MVVIDVIFLLTYYFINLKKIAHFTGCGRKRSGPAPLPVSRPLRSDDPMATLFDLNSEPAVAELSRQILSEAKLWEAIKEASRDEGRRRHSLEVGTLYAAHQDGGDDVVVIVVTRSGCSCR